MRQNSSWKNHWLAAVAPDEPHKLKRRLAWDKLSEDEFETRLDQELREVDESVPWRGALNGCCEALRAHWDTPLRAVPADEQRPFVDIWWPIREYASLRLAAELGLADSRGFDVSVYIQLAETLVDRLCDVSEQVLWESFRSDRSYGAILLAHLGDSRDGSGPPVRELYLEYVRKHRQNGLSDLLGEFPEFGRIIGTVFVLWLKGSETMLRRVVSDRGMLEKVFSIPASHRLHGVRQGLSDPHRGGQAVAILRFASANDEPDIRVVYKPKEMGLDAAYHSLLRTLNRHSDLAPLRDLAIHAADGYGYMEFVSHQPSSSEEQLHSFYANAGRLTALLHWLGCTDCHHENLIACADQLLLIDTETLLEPDLPDHILEASANSAQPSPSRLQERVQSSVLRSGLLPQWLFLGDAKKPLDISALGISPPEQEQELLPGWLGINSDGMMPGQVSRIAEIPTSLPVGVGVRNPFSRHIDAFCAGFESQCNDFIALRPMLLADDGPLAKFAGLTRRIVLRATRVYFVIQRQMLEPQALRSSLAQTVKLEQLARIYLMAETKPLNWSIYAAERQQMWLLDIPFFTHTIDGDTLQLNESGDTLAGFIRSSGLASAHERLVGLDFDEIAFQLRLIRGAVEARRLDVADDGIPHAQTSLTFEGAPFQETESFEAAHLIAKHLSELAIRDPGGQVEWLGMDLGVDGKSFAFGPVGMSLYGGAIGIACLIQRLLDHSVFSFDANALQTAILEPIRELVEQASDDKRIRWWRDEALGVSGCGGQLLALQQLGQMELVDGLIEAARPRFIEADQQLDVLGGCAGLIGPLLCLDSGAARDLAVLAGDHLLRHQSENGSFDNGAGGEPVLGFSHGAAGYAAALARLYEATGKERFRAGAAAALSLERSLYCKDAGNWPDYRESPFGETKRRFMVGWCSGAPGIAIGRACLWGTDLWDETCEQEIAIAIDTTAATPSLGTDHLCCGNIGLMLQMQLLCAGPWDIDPSVRGRAKESIEGHRLAALRRCSEHNIGLRCFGTKEGTLTLPGFFTGLSGMGMALLEDRASKSSAATLISAGLWSLGE